MNSYFSQGLADSTIVARVNNELWDLDRPLEGDCKLELLRWDNTDAQSVFWHSSAHMLGEAMERVSVIFIQDTYVESLELSQNK